MRISDFDYNLPKGLIAQYPCKRRDESRLLVLDRDRGTIEHRIFKDIVEYIHKGDLLLLNDTKVIPARLIGKKETGGKIETLILHRSEGSRSDAEHEVLLKPVRGCNVGSRLIFGRGELKAVVTRIENGRRFLHFERNGDLEEAFERLGEVPLPPYIKRDIEPIDKNRYQTVYASKKGAIAAPTAGLHFTRDILGRISRNGVDTKYVTLHVGYGTFKPVRCEAIERHRIEKEYFEVKKDLIERLRKRTCRKIAVGTTVCRALETVFSKGIYRGWTDLFIYPGYRFKAVDALLTNFHLPRTTLLMLVSAFCGTRLLSKAYQEAIEKGYRFYSYGDSMLVI